MNFDTITAQQLIDYIYPTIRKPVAIFDRNGLILNYAHGKKELFIREFRQIKQWNEGMVVFNDILWYVYRLEGASICGILILDVEDIPANIETYLTSVIKLILKQELLRKEFACEFSERLFLINHLTNTEHKEEDNMLALASRLKFELNIPRVSIILCLQTNSGDIHQDNDTKLLEKYFVRAVKESEYYCNQDIIGYLVQKNFLLFKAISPNHTEEWKEHIFKSVNAIRTNLFENYGISVIVGVGSMYSNLAKLRKSYKEARFLLANLHLLNSTVDVIFITDHIFEYINSQLPLGYLENKFKDTVAVSKANPYFLETLIALSASSYNLVRSAASLGIHRNTMLQRFTKIKEQFKVDPLHCDNDRIWLKQFVFFQNKKTLLHAAVVIQEGSALHAGYNKFAELLAIKSNGSIELSIHTISFSADNMHLSDILRSGFIDFAICTIEVLAECGSDKFLLLSLPFLFDSPEQAWYILEGSIGKELFKDLSPSGIIGMNFWSMGWRNITSNVPIRIPKDLIGQKIRIMFNDMSALSYETFGATPIKIKYDEINKALKQGLVNCQENPYINIMGMNLYKHQQYINELHQCLDLDALTTTKRAMEKLTAQQQKLVWAAADEAAQWQWREMERLNAIDRHTILDNNLLTLAPITDEERRQWIEVIKPIYKKCKHQEILLRILAEKEKFNAKVQPKNAV
jgi:TRAP-type C4-dicarboxylate transport system substrate-binding protein/sugar diacid utilization regulator